MAGVTTGEVISTPPMPLPAITSASPAVEQQMPAAPAAICRRAISIDLAPLLCGLSSIPAALVWAAMAAMLCSRASRSSSSAGVLSRARDPLTPTNFAFGPRPFDAVSAMIISRSHANDAIGAGRDLIGAKGLTVISLSKSVAPGILGRLHDGSFMPAQADARRLSSRLRRSAAVVVSYILAPGGGAVGFLVGAGGMRPEREWIGKKA